MTVLEEAGDRAEIHRSMRAKLPGVYIVGSKARSHYMIVEIDQNGTITGRDPQDGAVYDLAGLRDRMASKDKPFELDLALPVLPPEADHHE